MFHEINILEQVRNQRKADRFSAMGSGMYKKEAAHVKTEIRNSFFSQVTLIYMRPALHHRVAARYPAVWTRIYHDLHDIYEAEVLMVVRVVPVRDSCTSGPERST